MQIPRRPAAPSRVTEPYRRPFIVNLTFSVCGAAVVVLILEDLMR